MRRGLVSVTVWAGLLSAVAAMARTDPPAAPVPAQAQAQAPSQVPSQASTEAPIQAPTQSSSQASTKAPVDLVEVPPAAIGNFEPQDQEQLEAERDAVDSLVSSGQASPAALAQAFGRLGSLYFLYDLTGPAYAALTNASRLAPDEFAWHYYLGVLDFREGRPEEAEESLKQALAIRPDDLATIIRLGRLALDAGRFDEAKQRFDRALELDADSAAALAGLGRLAYEQDDPQKAIELFEHALKLQPDASSLHYQLGLAYRAVGDLERAKIHMKLNRHDPVVFADPLVAGLSPLLRGASVHIHRGTAAMKEGDLDRAFQEYQTAAELDPKDAKAQYNLGAVMLQRGRRDDAIPYLEHAVELDPDFRNAHVNLAAIYAASGDWARAAEHYGEAVRIDPLDSEAHLDWARALARDGKLERASEEIETLLGELPENRPKLRATATLELAALDERTDKPEAALEHYRAAAALDPSSRPAQLGLARSLGRSGDFAAAADAFSQAIALDPSDLGARYGRAMALLLGGQPANARDALEQDLNDSPGTLPLLHLLARVLATASDPAVRDGQQALKLALQVFGEQKNLAHAETVAMAYAEIGDFDQAIAWQQRVLDRAGPGSPPELVARARQRLALYQAGQPVREPWRDGQDP